MDISDVRRAEELTETLYSKQPERWTHVRDVIRVLREMRISRESRLLVDPQVFVAGYVHDVLDDAVITRPELLSALGAEALQYADDLAENFTIGCGRRCTFFENLPALKANPVALEVRLAGRFSNWRLALETGDKKRLAFYRSDYLLFRHELGKLNVSPYYWVRLDGLMEECGEAHWEIDGITHYGLVLPEVAKAPRF